MDVILGSLKNPFSVTQLFFFDSLHSESLATKTPENWTVQTSSFVQNLQQCELSFHPIWRKNTASAYGVGRCLPQSPCANGTKIKSNAKKIEHNDESNEIQAKFLKAIHIKVWWDICMFFFGCVLFGTWSTPTTASTKINPFGTEDLSSVLKNHHPWENGRGEGVANWKNSIGVTDCAIQGDGNHQFHEVFKLPWQPRGPLLPPALRAGGRGSIRHISRRKSPKCEF